MKNLLIAIICLLLLIIPWGIYDRYAAVSTETYKDVIMNNVIPAAESGHWQQAEKSFRLVAEDWNRFKSVSTYFIDTATVDEVNYDMTKVYRYIQQHDTVNVVAEAAALTHRLDYLHTNESPSPGNIL